LRGLRGRGMSNSRKYSVAVQGNKAAIWTESLETAIDILEMLQVPLLISEDEDTAIDIRGIQNITITIQLEGEIQRVKIASPSSRRENKQ